MELRDGFIVGISDYCDSWCETCAFTSRCRLFAQLAEVEAQNDPNLQPIAGAPPLAVDVLPPPPGWMQELIAEINKTAAEPISKENRARFIRKINLEHEPIEALAHAYGDRVHAWFERRRFDTTYASSDPRSVIRWFHYSIAAKTHRALKGLACDEPEDRDWPADHDGSAKVALIGIERSHAAWLQLVDSGLASLLEVEPFICDLIRLTDELDRVFPRARAFVRAGFDEPDEVAKLLAAEGGR
jgi:hypothetical protein